MSDDCLTYSIPEAGKLLGYSRNTAYEAARRKEIPTIRLGRKIRVPKAALQRMLDSVMHLGELEAMTSVNDSALKRIPVTDISSPRLGDYNVA